MTLSDLNYPSKKLFETGGWVDSQINTKFINIKSLGEEYMAAIKNSTWWDVLKEISLAFFYRYGYLFL
ncbi:MAG: hypothetical protein IPQ06_15750 [Chitinophagaceae bacterium]|nr:hypothetical protein [Chitinophagaceae bacterium]